MISTNKNLDLSEKIIKSSNNRINAWQFLLEVFLKEKLVKNTEWNY